MAASDEPFPYEIPSAAGGDEGIEGFAVEAGGIRVGRVAALNTTPNGLALVVDSGDAYRVVDIDAVRRIETGRGAVVVAADALATAGRVVPRVPPGDGAHLIRHIPRALDRLLVAEGSATARHLRLWYVGAALTAAGGVGVMAGPVVAATSAGGALRWLWVGVPALVLVVGASALWTALGRSSPRPLSRREKLADALALVLGISPRTRRRG